MVANDRRVARGVTNRINVSFSDEISVRRSRCRTTHGSSSVVNWSCAHQTTLCRLTKLNHNSCRNTSITAPVTQLVAGVASDRLTAFVFLRQNLGPILCRLTATSL